MPIVKFKAGETVLVAAVDPSLEIGGGPVIDPRRPRSIPATVSSSRRSGDLRPTHPIVLPPPVPDPPHLQSIPSMVSTKTSAI